MKKIYNKIIKFSIENKSIIIIIIIIFVIIVLIFLRETKRNIIYSNTTKPNLYCFWTGTNPLTKNRKNNLKTLKNTGFNVVLVTPNNLNDYILKEHPLHRGYQYLSEVHKADYLRCYFMNFYGGGYSDIKKINESWLKQYNKLIKSDYWGCGYSEKSPDHIGYGKDKEINEKMRSNYNQIIGNGCYIFKSNTPLTNEWYKNMIKIMEEKYEDLIKYPSKDVRQVYSREYPYPFQWTELLGQIYHPIVYKYKDKLIKDLPYVNIENYR